MTQYKYSKKRTTSRRSKRRKSIKRRLPAWNSVLVRRVLFETVKLAVGIMGAHWVITNVGLISNIYTVYTDLMRIYYDWVIQQKFYYGVGVIMTMAVDIVLRNVDPLAFKDKGLMDTISRYQAKPSNYYSSYYTLPPPTQT